MVFWFIRPVNYLNYPEYIIFLCWLHPKRFYNIILSTHPNEGLMNHNECTNVNPAIPFHIIGNQDV